MGDDDSGVEPSGDDVIGLCLDEVGSQRVTVLSSDHLDRETLFKWYHEDGTFPTAPSRTVQATFIAHGSPDLGCSLP
jgi:hypothetical protein